MLFASGDGGVLGFIFFLGLMAYGMKKIIISTPASVKDAGQNAVIRIMGRLFK